MKWKFRNILEEYKVGTLGLWERNHRVDKKFVKRGGFKGLSKQSKASLEGGNNHCNKFKERSKVNNDHGQVKRQVQNMLCVKLGGGEAKFLFGVYEGNRL